MKKNRNVPKGKSRKAGNAGRKRRPNNNGGYNKSSKKIRAPVSQGSTLVTRRPRIVNSPNGGVRITHREPLGIVNGSTGFVNVQYSINPGLSQTFPWLAFTAQNFEAYRFKRLSIEYLTSSASSIAGAICIAPDYNSSDGAPISFQTIEQFQDAYRDLVWSDGECIINPRSMGMMGPDRYIRLGPLASNLDIKTYDVAVINVATTGQANTNQIGELWVNYDIELFEPTSFSLASAQMNGTLVNLTGTGALTTSLLGTNPVAAGRVKISAALNVITLSNLVIGESYLLTYCGSAVTFTTAPTMGTFTGFASEINYYSGVTGGDIGLVQYSAVASSTTATFTLGGVTVLTTPNLAYIDVSMLPSAAF